MGTVQPRQLFVVTVGGWINQHQQDAIDYLVAMTNDGGLL
jgi:hypothetical protein